MNQLNRYRETSYAVFFILFACLSSLSAFAGGLCPEQFTLPSESANTDHHFSTRKVSASIQGLHVYEIQHFVDLNLTWLRSNYAGEQLPEQWKSSSQLSDQVQRYHRINAQTDRERAIRERNQALDDIYHVYKNQGPERSSQLQVYRAEDVSKAERTAHLTVTSHGETIAHLQYQTSNSINESLNLEDHFDSEKSFIRGTASSQSLSEMGRLEILDKDQAKATQNKELLSNRRARDFLFYTLWAEVLLEIQSKRPNDFVLFQVNQKTLEKLEFYFFKTIQFKAKKKVSLGPDLPQEWLVKLSPDEISQLAEVSVQKWATILITQFLERTSSPDVGLLFSVSPNFARIFERLGVYSASQKSLHRQAMNLWRRQGIPEIFISKRLAFLKQDIPPSREIINGEHIIGIGVAEARELLQKWNEQDQVLQRE